MPPFFVRLKAYWNDVGASLRGGASTCAVFPNPSDMGLTREKLYEEFLRMHVPPTCTVKLGGFVFGSDGSESSQMDILVPSAVSPQYDFLNRFGNGKTFACVDGLVAAVSVKSNLDRRGLSDAIKNLSSLPAVAPIGQRYMPFAPKIEDYEAWPLKIIYAPKGEDIKKTLATLTECIRDVPQDRRPDFIHVCGKYVVAKIGADGGCLRDGTRIEPYAYYAHEDNPDAWAFAMIIHKMQLVEQSMRFMLFPCVNVIDYF